MSREIHIDRLDVDEQTREQIRECLESAAKLEGRAPSYVREQRDRADALAGLDGDDDATVVLERVDPAPGSLEALREDYELSELVDRRELDDEIELLEQRHSAMQRKTPEYAERLEARIDALRGLKQVAGNQYTETPKTWDALAESVQRAADNGDVLIKHD